MQPHEETVWLGGQDTYKNRTFQWSLSESPVSSSLLNISNNSWGDSLVWHKTSEGIYYDDRNGTELYNFVCQTDAVNTKPNYYIIPVMPMEGTSKAFIHITASYASIVVYLDIYTVYDGVIQDTSTLQLTYTRAVDLEIPSSQNIYDTYTYSRYVKVHSSQPVAVVLYIMNANADQASSTLILPNSLYTDSTSYILHSAYTNYDNTITVLSKESGVSNISLIYDIYQSKPTFSIGHVQMGAFVSASASLQAMNEALSFSLRANLDGSFLFANQSFGTFLQYKVKTSLIMDHTMDTMIPVDLLGSEYILFPSDYNKWPKVYFKLVAAHEWTHIKIYSSSSTIVDSFILKSVGDTLERSYMVTVYYNIIGNTTFYAYKLSEPGKPVCVTSLLPISAWKYQYDIYISPVLSSYTIFINLAVPTEYKTKVETNIKPITNKTGNIGSPVGPIYTAVIYTLPKVGDKYYHIQLADKVKPFAAYVYATNTRSSFCHPLGFSHSTEQATDIFDQQAYIDQLIPQETTQPQVTCSVEETTTSFLMENATFENTGSTDYTEIYSTMVDTTLETTEDTTLKTTEYTTLETTGHTTIDTTVYTPLDTTEDSTSYMSTETTIMDSSVETSADYGTLDYRLSTMKTYADIDISDLIIQAKNTSAYRRTLMSIQDTRLSAQMIGGFGIIIITCVFTLISMGDLTNLVQFVSKFICKKQKQES